MSSDYRKLYEQEHKVKVPKSYEIHHIDFNHDNNDILNLVALPKKLHKELHMRYDTLKSCGDWSISDIYICSGRVCGRSYFINALYKYLSVLDECVPYMNQGEIELMREKGVAYVYR